MEADHEADAKPFSQHQSDPARAGRRGGGRHCRHIDKLHTPLVLCIGTLETPEFQRQSRDFVAAVKAAGKPAELVVGEHYNHFEVGDTIGHPYQLIGRELMKMMKLSMT